MHFWKNILRAATFLSRSLTVFAWSTYCIISCSSIKTAKESLFISYKLYRVSTVNSCHVCQDAGSGLVLQGWTSHLRRDALWGFDADAGVPFARRKNRHLIQKLIDPRQQVIPVLRLVGNIVENLPDRKREKTGQRGRN